MMFPQSITMFAFASIDSLTSLDNRLFEIVNSLAGHSMIFDTLTGLALENSLVKAAFVGACFMLVWLGGKDAEEMARRRRILLVTVVASFMVVAATKSLSKTVFLPRPFILSQRSFHLEGEKLVETQRLEFRAPLDESGQKSLRELRQGEIFQNDLGSFPSDHAGFFLTIAFGVMLASRVIGLAAVAWTLLVTLGSRMVTGLHSPLDIAAGSAIGIAALLSLQFLVDRFGRRAVEPVVNWTIRNSALSASLLFLYLFESTDTLDNIRPLLKAGRELVKNATGV